MRVSLIVSAICLILALPGIAEQNAPQPAPVPTPAPMPEPATRPVTKKETESVNAILLAARKATAEKRYADSEALMETVTRDNPSLILPWVELGLAQLGEKKYTEAESSFDKALGIDPASLKAQHSDDFYVPSDQPGTVAPGATRASRNTAGGEVVTNAESRGPEVRGVSYASLGEIYAHQGKIDQAKAAFDEAVKANPSQAATYRRNETIYFFQAGNSEAQLEAANQAIELDPARAANYYFKAQALVSKATVDLRTQKMVLPPGCAEAYQKYLQLEPSGPYSADAKGVLAGAGLSGKTSAK